MHELSLAVELVERAAEIARREQAKKVTEIEVMIGDLSGVDAEAFAFAFPEAARGTVLADASLKIERTAGNEFQFKTLEVEDSHV